jgi:hypothetical protein
MKSIQQVARSISPQSVPSKQVSTAVDRAEGGTVDVVNALFKELQSIFPAWKQAWPDDKALQAAKRSWVKGFMSEGITTLEQIRYGLQQCRKSGCDFAPSVGRFILWCRPTPEMIGMPADDLAYREACEKSHPSISATAVWSHQGVYHAACETGFFTLSSLPAEKSRPIFNRNYAITIRMLLAGEPLRSIPLALPETVDGRCTPEIGRAALAALRKAVANG